MTDPAPAAPLRFDKLSKNFDGLPALRDVTFDIPHGSVTGLLGRNSAGKSSLLQCAVGLIKPTSGRATLFDQNCWSLDADAKSRLGYVPQTIALYLCMRV